MTHTLDRQESQGLQGDNCSGLANLAGLLSATQRRCDLEINELRCYQPVTAKQIAGQRSIGAVIGERDE